MNPRSAGHLLIASAVFAICTHMSPTFGEIRPAPRLLRSPNFGATSTESIAVGDSLDQVRRVFGRLPDELDGTCFYSDGSGRTIDCVAKTLVYPGFTADLVLLPGSSDYRTTHISVRARDLLVTPGLTVGMSTKAVKNLLGKPDLSAVDGSSGDRIFHYSFDAERGDLRIHFKNGAVSLIELSRREWPIAG